MRQVDIYVPDCMNVSADGIDLLVSAQLHLSYQLLLSSMISICRYSYTVAHGERKQNRRLSTSLCC